MQEASEASVLGDFNAAEFIKYGLRLSPGNGELQALQTELGKL